MYKKEEVIAWVKKYFEINGNCKAIIGISGGCDSTVTAKILCEAIGKENVIGVLMPCGVQHDIDVSIDVCKLLGIKYYVVNIEEPVNNLKKLIEEQVGVDPNNYDAYKTNTPSRVRMTTLYGICALYGGRVANTCNLSEDYVGYSTKFGDAAGDFSPLSMITKTEVRILGKELGLPSRFVDKIPEDGMSGKSDEEKLGFSYETLDRYIRSGEIDSIETKERIEKLHRMNLHKLKLMPTFGRDEL